ncbi:CATSPER1 [Symbiodinium sp. CCMP2592]|nr:CATSPER1 [Symbiodinium sp. CCMP2592]
MAADAEQPVKVDEPTKELIKAFGQQQRQLQKLADQQRAAWDVALLNSFAALEESVLRACRERLAAEAITGVSTQDVFPTGDDEFPRQMSDASEGSVSSGISDLSPPASPRQTTGESQDEKKKHKRSKGRKETSGSKSSKQRKGTMTDLLQGAEIQSKKPSGGQLALQKFRHYMDHVAGGLVLLNSILLMVQLELEGRQLALELGLPDGESFESMMPIFSALDTIFVFVFLVELLIRIALERCLFLKDIANWLDFILVAGGMVDLVLSSSAIGGGDQNAQDMVTLRFVSALKAFRAIRMVRSFRFSPGLRMLVKACQCCLPSLCWSMLLLAVFMCMGALILGNLLQDYIRDGAQSMVDRQWVWERYGTTYRATYTLYEITFAGNWPTNVRPILDKVSHAFVIFYLLYITVIVFAVIRVISAIFLKDTLDEANNDAQHLVLDRMRKRAVYVERLEAVFHAIIEHDGQDKNVLTEKRLVEILADPKVKAYFSTLEIDVQESAALFNLLDNGDGMVTLEEFINGIMRCKGPARAIDTFALHSDVKQLDAKLRALMRMTHLGQASSEPPEQPVTKMLTKEDSPWENPAEKWGVEGRLSKLRDESPPRLQTISEVKTNYSALEEPPYTGTR